MEFIRNAVLQDHTLHFEINLCRHSITWVLSDRLACLRVLARAAYSAHYASD